MGAVPIPAGLFFWSLVAVLVIEAAASSVSFDDTTRRLIFLGGVRLLETAVMAGLAAWGAGGTARFGLGGETLLRGGVTGCAVSFGFGLLAGFIMAALWATGASPFFFPLVPLPDDPFARRWFFVVGAGVAPLAEELFFRGFVYGFFRRWGRGAALLTATALFTLAHARAGGDVVIPLVGGLVFGLSYEKSGSLAAPVIVHAAGNLALFTLSALLG